jgi:hypothetical protein
VTKIVDFRWSGSTLIPLLPTGTNITHTPTSRHTTPYHGI